MVFQIREFSLGVMEWLMEMEKKGKGDKEGIMRERTLKFFLTKYNKREPPDCGNDRCGQTQQQQVLQSPLRGLDNNPIGA